MVNKNQMNYNRFKLTSVALYLELVNPDLDLSLTQHNLEKSMTRTKLVDPRPHFSRTRAQINQSEADSNIIADLNQTKSEIHNCPASYDTMNNSDYLMSLFFPKTQIITIPK